MARIWLCLPLALGLALGGYALAQTGATGGQDNERVAQLVKQLGSSKYAEREKARHDLEAIGLAALDQLRKASKDSDLETAKRCQELIKKLETKLASDVLLAPKKVKLRFQETPVLQAIQELQKQSGYQIQFEGTQGSLLKRTVTVDTGEVTFWEAFDKLCQAADLVEVPLSRYQNSPITTTTPRAVQLVPVPQALPVPAPPAVPVPQAVPPGKVLPPIPGGQLPNQAGQAVQPPGQAGVAGAQALPVQVQGQVHELQQLQFIGGATAQVLPAQVQVQVQPGNAGVIQIQPAPAAGRVGVATPVRVDRTGIIVVKAGVPEKVPTFYHGALRIRLLPASRATEITVQPRQEGEALFVVEVSPEPRLQQFSVIGMPRVEKAMDDQGQELKMTIEPMVPAVGLVGNTTSAVSDLARAVLPRQVTLRLKLGAQQAKTLKELTGTLSIQCLSVAPEALITLGDIMKAAGKSAKGENGGSIELLDLQKQANGTYKVSFRYQPPTQFFPAANGAAPPAVGPAGAGAVPNPAVNVAKTTIAGLANLASTMPTLVDAHGKALALESRMSTRSTAVNGQITQEITLVFRAGDGVGEPAQMILIGHRMQSAQVPFRFEGVKLP